MTTRQAFAISLALGFSACAAITARAETPASQLAQAQTIMGSNNSPESRLDYLYNGGGAAARPLNAAAPVPAQYGASGVRHLDIGVAPPSSGGLDRAVVPSLVAPALGQAKFGYSDPDVAAPVCGATLIVVYFLIPAALGYMIARG